MTGKKRSGLGRGLSALIPDTQKEESSARPLDVFFPGESQARSESAVRDLLNAPMGKRHQKAKRASAKAKSAAEESSTKQRKGSRASGTSKASQSASVSRETTQENVSDGSGTSDAHTKPKRTASVDGGRSNTNSTSNAGISVASPAGLGVSIEGVHGWQHEDDNSVTGVATALIEDTSEQDVALDATHSRMRGGNSENLVSRETFGGHKPLKAIESETDEAIDSFDQPVDPNELLAVPGATFGELPVWSIIPNRAQPREHFDPDELAELVESIKQVGVLQPIIVRPLDPAEAQRIQDERLKQVSSAKPAEAEVEMEPAADVQLTVAQIEDMGAPRYELIMGERRLRATRLAGLETVPAIVRYTEDGDLLRDALLENLHRVQLNPIEEAAAYQQLLDDFGCTQEELSKRVARSRPQIANTLRLLKLPATVQQKVAAGTISAGHARALLRLKSATQMLELADRILAEGLSVRSVEEIVALDQGEKKAARPRKVAAPLPDHLARFATDLGDRLDTRVSIHLGKSRSKIVIESADEDDLQRIIALLEQSK